MNEAAFYQKSRETLLAQVRAERDNLQQELHQVGAEDKSLADLLGKCILTCDRILVTHQEKTATELPSDEKWKEFLSPEEKLIEEIRTNLRKGNENKVPIDILGALFNWPARIDYIVHQHSLGWINETYHNLEKQALRWQEKLDSTRGGFGLFSRFRTMFLAKKIKQIDATNDFLTRQINKKRENLNLSLNMTRVVAGMLSATLKLGTGMLAQEHKLIRKVFDLENEREINSHLKRICNEYEGRIGELEEDLKKTLEELKKKKDHHKNLEGEKNSLFVDLYTKTRFDPKKLLANATFAQICNTYMEVDRLIDVETNKLNQEQKKTKEIKKEFIKLAEVVHEYGEDKKLQEEGKGKASRALEQTKATRKLTCKN